MAQAQKRRPASNWAPVEAPPPKPPTFVDRLIDAITRHRSALRRLGLAASVIIIAGALTIFVRTLAHIDPGKFKAAIAGTGGDQILLSFAFTTLSYLALTGYDGLALRHLGIKVPYRLTALASFTSYAFSFTLGFPLVTGGAVRYWVYGPAGLSAGKIAASRRGGDHVLARHGARRRCRVPVGVRSDRRHRSFPSAGQSVDRLGRYRRADRLHRLDLPHAPAGCVGSRQLRLPGPRLTLGQMALGVIDICSAAGGALCSAAAG